MEQRQRTHPASASGRGTSRLPPGRLSLERVAAALAEDGLIGPEDAKRVQLPSGARHASEVHPLVLIANLKLASGQTPGTDLGLERLSE